MHFLGPHKRECLLVYQMPLDWDTAHYLFPEGEDRLIWPVNLSFYRLMICTKKEIYISMKLMICKNITRQLPEMDFFNADKNCQ